MLLGLKQTTERPRTSHPLSPMLSLTALFAAPTLAFLEFKMCWNQRYCPLSQQTPQLVHTTEPPGFTAHSLFALPHTPWLLTARAVSGSGPPGLTPPSGRGAVRALKPPPTSSLRSLLCTAVPGRSSFASAYLLNSLAQILSPQLTADFTLLLAPLPNPRLSRGRLPVPSSSG